MIFKKVNEEVAKKVKEGFLRIGSLKYYKKIEDRERRDNLEGIPDKKLFGNGRIFTPQEVNKINESVGSVFRIKKAVQIIGEGAIIIEGDWNIHIFCTSVGDNEIAKSLNKFGSKAFEIINPERFSKIVANVLYEQYKNDLLKNKEIDTVYYFNKKVEYLDTKDSKDYIKNDELGLRVVDIQAAFTKPGSFSDESEHRFIWSPQSKNLHVPLTYGHEYVDIYIPNLENEIKWLC